MTIQRFETGKRMSQIVVHGDTVYLAGQVGHGDTVAEQTRDALANMEKLLKQVGSDKSKLLQVTIWLADMEADFAAMNEVWDNWVEPGAAPARACGEAKLATPDYKVEFIAIAAK